MKSKNKKISLKMHDIKPTWEGNRFALKKNQKTKISFSDIKKNKDSFEEENLRRSILRELEKEKLEKKEIPKKEIIKEQNQRQYLSKTKKPKKNFDFTKVKKIFFLSFKVAICAIIFISFFNFARGGLWIKNQGISSAETAFAEILEAKNSMKKGDFEKSYVQFENSYKRLDKVSQKFDTMGVFLVGATKYVPYLSKISSGKNLISVGKNFSEIGMLVSTSFINIEGIKTKNEQENPLSYLEIFLNSKENLDRVSQLLKNSRENLENVNMDDVPESERGVVMEIKKILPQANNTLDDFLEKEDLIVDILGGNGPRKYLFLFQNNQEMRATGGFIGSYGILDIFNGKVRKFFIDGIFNPDGQLREKIVPPTPIQKISANWSLHDSNWFPDFPLSAQKAAWFYEKTGGPTVDGVIAITPTVMQKLLEIVGPIELVDYGIVINSDNFVEKIQQEVEVDYDKDLNQPKKIIADAAPKILDKILTMENFSDISKTANVFLKSLNEKHILMYSKNEAVEKFLSENGWSGEILKTDKDYFSVINTNINGFKTDGVVLENITHKVEIQPDGTIIDTLTVKREHQGGETAYDWWNRVNADYMRVYVPMGSKLLSVEGHTREFNASPLDYDALKFKRDDDVQMEENSIEIDENTGTRIYEDCGKTVFANWVYVSPKESVTVEYVYLLPFKIDFEAGKNSAAYSLLAQKQSGSFGSGLNFEIKYPKSYNVLWKSLKEDDSMTTTSSFEENKIEIKTDLKTNKFFGIAFSR